MYLSHINVFSPSLQLSLKTNGKTSSVRTNSKETDDWLLAPPRPPLLAARDDLVAASPRPHSHRKLASEHSSTPVCAQRVQPPTALHQNMLTPEYPTALVRRSLIHLLLLPNCPFQTFHTNLVTCYVPFHLA